MKIHNRFSNVNDETEDDIKEGNYKVTKVVMEAALSVGGVALKSRNSKLSKEKKSSHICKSKRMIDEIRWDELT